MSISKEFFLEPIEVSLKPCLEMSDHGVRYTNILSGICTISKEMDNTEPTEVGICIETPGPKKMALKLFLQLVLVN